MTTRIIFENYFHLINNRSKYHPFFDLLLFIALESPDWNVNAYSAIQFSLSSKERGEEWKVDSRVARKGSPIESRVWRETIRVYPACYSCHFPLAFRKNYPKEGIGKNGGCPCVKYIVYHRLSTRVIFVALPSYPSNEFINVDREKASWAKYIEQPSAPFFPPFRVIWPTFASRWRFLHFPPVRLCTDARCSCCNKDAFARLSWNARLLGSLLWAEGVFSRCSTEIGVVWRRGVLRNRREFANEELNETARERCWRGCSFCCQCLFYLPR